MDMKHVESEIIAPGLLVEKPETSKEQIIADKLLNKIEGAMDKLNGHPGNPFNGVKFTDEERRFLAEVGIV